MKRFLSFSILAGLMVSMAAFAEETPIQYAFSGATAEENKVTLQGAGFGAYPQASVTFGYIPTDNAFDGATDGQGVIITALPGEGVMVFGQKITTANVAIVRCSIRTDQPTASVIIATIGDEPDVFVSQNTPNNKGYFTGQYLRLQTFCTPPSTGFQPVIQILNTSATDTLTAYLDNFEIYLLDPNKYYSTAFLDGDEIDPPADKIGIPSDAESGAVSPTDISIKIGEIVTVTEVNIAMALIPSGTFTMGNQDFGPQHQVTISKPFYMGKYEITQAQWRAVMGNNPSYFKGDNLPVETVTWTQCQEFIAKLNGMNVDSGTFRLPTEAEWEYACRAGTKTEFYWGEDSSYSQIGSYAWYWYNSSNQTHEVGTKSPNNWGLYDMSGNVLEWCQDRFGSYSSGTQIDPVGAVSGSCRMFRGGCWYARPWEVRSAHRNYWGPDYTCEGLGFRLVLVRT